VTQVLSLEEFTMLQHINNPTPSQLLVQNLSIGVLVRE
jgi:hypothetical protein